MRPNQTYVNGIITNRLFPCTGKGNHNSHICKVGFPIEEPYKPVSKSKERLAILLAVVGTVLLVALAIHQIRI